MFCTEKLSEKAIFPGTVAGIRAGIPDLFTRQDERLNQMVGMKFGSPSASIDARDDLTQKSDFVTAATVSSRSLDDSLSDFGLPHGDGDDAQFENSLKFQSDISPKNQLDEITRLDFAVGDAVEERVRSASRTAGLIAVENWTFDFTDYTIDHQGLNTLNIKVGYELKPGIAPAEYPDFVPIYKSIDNFLVDYPNETDFWQIINKNLTQKVLDENPAMTDVRIQREILPSNRLPYDRTSTVFRSRSGKLEEDWNFSVNDYAINHQGFNKLNLDVNYQYLPEITNEEYPDFVPIYQKTGSKAPSF